MIIAKTRKRYLIIGSNYLVSRWWLGHENCSGPIDLWKENPSGKGLKYYTSPRIVPFSYVYYPESEIVYEKNSARLS